ncbi:MAG TPA: PP0621 family protein [Burkholderiaceae bacterium]|jgi:uncharacterized protein
MRLLIWLVVALAVFTWIKRALAPTASGQRRPSPGEEKPETMLQCARCGVHFPASEAVRGAGDSVFCSADHRG